MKKLCLISAAVAIPVSCIVYCSYRLQCTESLNHNGKPTKPKVELDSSMAISTPESKGRAPSERAVPGLADLPSTPSARQYADRIHGLGRKLSQQEQETLIAWITGPKPSHLRDGSWHFVVNEVMDVLCHQNQSHPAWTDTLIGLVVEENKDKVLRDYAIQHLADRLEPTSAGEPYEADPAKRQRILDTIIQAAKQTNDTCSGTALQVLNLALRDHNANERQQPASSKIPVSIENQLRQLAVHTATSADAHNLAQITAIQICSQRGFDEVLPVVRRIASDESASLPTRRSALASLGQLGQASDMAVLEGLTRSASPELRLAIVPAIKSLKQRQLQN